MRASETPLDESSASPAAAREQLFLSNLSLIRRVTAVIAKRRRLSDEAAEELKSEVLFRLIRNDYAVLAKFRGKSTLATFLAPVIDRIYLDMRVATWGKWRPSARSRRFGELGVMLERLTVRDGLTFDEACAVLEIDRRLSFDRDVLARLHAGYPRRVQRRALGDEALASQVAPDAPPDDGVVAVEETSVLEGAARALSVVVRALPDEDRRLLKFFYRDKLSLATISRVLPADQKALYRRFSRLLQQLRTDLQAAGIDGATVLPLIGRRNMIATAAFDWVPHPAHNRLRRPALREPIIEPPTMAEMTTV